MYEITREDCDNPSVALRSYLAHARSVLHLEPEEEDIVPRWREGGFESASVYFSESAGALEHLRLTNPFNSGNVLLAGDPSSVLAALVDISIDTVFSRRAAEDALLFDQAKRIARLQVVVFGREDFLARFDGDEMCKVWFCQDYDDRGGAFWAIWDRDSWQTIDQPQP